MVAEFCQEEVHGQEFVRDRNGGMEESDGLSKSYQLELGLVA